LTNTGKYEGQHVVVTTLGSLQKAIVNRKSIDLSALKVVVIDEVDFFFADKYNRLEIQKLTTGTFKKLKQTL